jgi:hypothetical protein
LLREVLPIAGFARLHLIPREIIERWIRTGRLNATNGLAVYRGRTYIDAKLFGRFFSSR